MDGVNIREGMGWYEARGWNLYRVLPLLIELWVVENSCCNSCAVYWWI